MWAFTASVVRSHCLEEECGLVRLCGLVEELWRDLDAGTRQVGLLARTALAMLALEYLEQPPGAAIEHAAAVLADEAPISAAWLYSQVRTHNRPHDTCHARHA
jgi:hypothetical protein